jgi:hypothetical protein
MDAFKHSFIFSPGSWVGEGKILLSMVEEDLHFTTRWAVPVRDFAGQVSCQQHIQIQNYSDKMCNTLTFYDFDQKAFSVQMDNPNIGQVIGKGVFDDKLIAWEFRDVQRNFEGFETYTLQPDGSYLMRGEYVTSDQFRTQIEARIFLHSIEPPEEGEEEQSDGMDGEEGEA